MAASISAKSMLGIEASSAHLQETSEGEAEASWQAAGAGPGGPYDGFDTDICGLHQELREVRAGHQERGEREV